MHRRKIRATTRENLEINGVGALYGRGHLDAQQHDTLAMIVLWLERLARGWGGLGGVTGLCTRFLGAAVPTGFVRPQKAIASGLADSARQQLERALRQLDGNRDLVIALAEGRVPALVLRAIEDRLTIPDKVALERPRQGLDRLAGRWQRAARP